MERWAVVPPADRPPLDRRTDVRLRTPTETAVHSPAMLAATIRKIVLEGPRRSRDKIGAVGLVGIARLVSLGAFLSSTLSACVDISDPILPCGPLELGAPDEDENDTALASRLVERAPMIAISAMTRDERFSSMVVYPLCADERLDCGLRAHHLDLTPGSQIAVTGTGNWVVGIDNPRGDWRAWRLQYEDDLTAPSLVLADEDDAPDPSPYRIVASLRDQDRLLVRDGGEHSRLYAVTPGTREIVRFPEAEKGTFVLAVGHRFAVLGKAQGYRGDWLYFVAVGPFTAKEQAQHELMNEGAVLRVGPIPGLEDVFLSPDDSKAAVSRFNDGFQETLVFDVLSGAKIDGFDGSPISLDSGRQELPGLSAFSPDSSRLSYRRSDGDLALRNLTTRGSCAVRPGDHRIAGFSADGILFAEARQYSRLNDKRGTSEVVTIDLSTGVGQRLPQYGSAEERDFHLVAVPAEHDSVPWAIGTQDGALHLLQPELDPVRLADSTREPEPPELLPKTGSGMWLLRSSLSPSDAGGDDRSISIQRIVATEPDADEYEIAFTQPEVHLQMCPSNTSPRPLTHITAASHPISGYVPPRPNIAGPDPIVDMSEPTLTFQGNEHLCISTAIPGRWAYRCRPASVARFFEGSDRPSSEVTASRSPDALERAGYDEELPPFFTGKPLPQEIP